MLSRIDRRPQATENLMLGQFVGQRFNVFFFVASLVPCAFLVLKFAGLEIVNISAADSIARVLGFIWPVLPSQYAALKSLATDHDASNYSIFFLCLFLVGALFLIVFISDCLKVGKAIKRASWGELLIMSILICLSYYVLFLDIPKTYPKPMFNFYVDQFGLYYLRQFVMFLGVYFAVMVLVALVPMSGARSRV
jgi:hypothetical protein